MEVSMKAQKNVGPDVLPIESLDPAAYQRARRKDIILNGPRLLDATGSKRMLGALMAIGYPGQTLSRIMKREPSWISKFMRQELVQKATARRIKQVYDALWDKPRPTSTAGEKHAASYAKTMAQRWGYPPPLAWDDDTINDPAAQPYVGKSKSVRGASLTMHEVNHLRGFGVPDDLIAERLGVEASSLYRAEYRSKAAA
jgi:hypothetical protein